MESKIDFAIKRLKEFQICENEQKVITDIKDGNKILGIIVKEVSCYYS